MKEKSFLFVVALFVFFTSSMVASAEKITLASGRVIEVSSDTANTLNKMKESQTGTPAPTATSENYGVAPAPKEPGFNSIAPQKVVVSESAVKGEEASISSWVGLKELSLWGGAWQNSKADSKGAWFQGEAYKKFTLREKPEVFGLGVVLKLDRGSNESGADWGYTAFGPALSYYRELSTQDSFQAKFRLPYRWNKNDTGDDGFMPGLYTEYDRIVSRNDMLIISGEGWKFENDSFLGFQGGVEHRINRTLKLKGSLGVSWNYLANETQFSWGPNASLKFWDSLTVGASAGFSDEGTTAGIIVGLDFK